MSILTEEILAGLLTFLFEGVILFYNSFCSRDYFVWQVYA